MLMYMVARKTTLIFHCWLRRQEHKWLSCLVQQGQHSNTLSQMLYNGKMDIYKKHLDPNVCHRSGLSELLILSNTQVFLSFFPDLKHRDSERIKWLTLNKPVLSCKVIINICCFKVFFTKNKGIKYKAVIDR